ncbi:hypothetical protein BX616_009901 [Lobosporangium transversale]|uniref:XPA C-terminal domain-containing protein n=1 Tax=Lobosporangium transversale TaxID=64571 RepID=A0A1Y2GWN1_9FUNG|nr:hypothetical protein BCR41DRAFT_347797 [Lobosporangium transversale]KAF9913544.1 hypothetical protein BX616_009901 [Lobosporangium transversale]ORZ26710.1 hypothetical protein BCR41DRAFT_347797 [Lobosporangium transversale]|eukprot:XP_021884473.1 hypothetical protein BCR41DRAFT_347797 [Lobosporangium transversale]
MTTTTVRRSSRLVQKATTILGRATAQSPTTAASKTLVSTPTSFTQMKTDNTVIKKRTRRSNIKTTSTSATDINQGNADSAPKYSLEKNAKKPSQRIKRQKKNSSEKALKHVEKVNEQVQETAKRSTKQKSGAERETKATQAVKATKVTKIKAKNYKDVITTVQNRKRKAESIEENSTVESSHEGQEQGQVVKRKRVRKPNKAKAMTNEGGLEGIAEESSLSLLQGQAAAPLPINRTDPCVVLPVEIWHQILSLIPLSQVAKISVVSTAWLDGSRSYPCWKSICENNNLGRPKIKFRSHMAIVCSRSFWVCDSCHSYTTGRYNASDIPLPVARKDDDEMIWNLCHRCRLMYYNRFPEPLREVEDLYDWQENKITKTKACETYHLSENDLAGLYYEERENPHYRYAWPMRLYNRYTIQKRALKVHAGWVGIDAFKASIAKKRSAAFKVRQAEFKVRTSPKRSGATQTPTQEQTQNSPEAPGQEQWHEEQPMSILSSHNQQQTPAAVESNKNTNLSPTSDDNGAVINIQKIIGDLTAQGAAINGKENGLILLEIQAKTQAALQVLCSETPIFSGV